MKRKNKKLNSLGEDDVAKKLKEDQKHGAAYINLHYQIEDGVDREFIEGPRIGLYTSRPPGQYHGFISGEFLDEISRFLQKAVERKLVVKLSVLPSKFKKRSWEEI